uniref:hypothetical protein n=1 Tax=Flavobacterium sp. TaxID=239 RepID=UPI00404B58CF
MNQNKLEKQIKEVFQERKINPSPMAWDRLDAMLSVAEQPKKKVAFKFWHVAAALILLATTTLVVTNFVKKTELEIVPNQEVVIENSQEANAEEIVIANPEKPSETEVTESPKVSNKVQVLPNKKNAVAVSNTNDKKEVEINKSQAIDNRETLVAVENLVLDEKVKLNSNAASLLAEIESNEAMVSFNNVKPIEISTVKVDANALLKTSEKEVNHSFRMKVIKNINIVKSSLANRNLE